MAFVPATGIAEFDMRYTSYGNGQENVYHVLHTDLSQWSNAQLGAMATVLINWETASAAAERATDFGLQSLFSRDLSVQAGHERLDSPTVPGTLAGGAAPENVTLSFKADSGVAGRSNRGRTYWIGLVKTLCANDRYDQTHTNNIATALNALLTNVNAVANCQMVILSGHLNGAVRNPRVGVPITRWVAVDNVIDSQRRRLLNHNRHR